MTDVHLAGVDVALRVPGEELGHQGPARSVGLRDQHEGLVDRNEVLEPLPANRRHLETVGRKDLQLSPVFLEERLSHADPVGRGRRSSGARIHQAGRRAVCGGAPELLDLVSSILLYMPAARHLP
jgi:hypothetical protein